MIDDKLYEELKELYKSNIQLFEQQNSGYVIEKINDLTIEALEKVIDSEKEFIDIKYIYTHYVNFTINPQITSVDAGYTTKIELSPDISWECKK